MTESRGTIHSTDTIERKDMTVMLKTVQKMKYLTTINHVSPFSGCSFTLCINREGLMPNKTFILVSTETKYEYEAGPSEQHTKSLPSAALAKLCSEKRLLFTSNSTIPVSPEVAEQPPSGMRSC